MINRSLSLWLSFGLLLLVAACSEAPNFPIEPVITFKSINKTRVVQFTRDGPLDSLIIQFDFTDGDGDLSSLDSSKVDILLRDSRVPEPPQNRRFPLIEEAGTGSGISGTVTMIIPNRNNICCIYQEELCAINSAYPVDTFSYFIQIVDRAGHVSNIINTGPIEIDCLVD